jgi:hypothetical protein
MFDRCRDSNIPIGELFFLTKIVVQRGQIRL